jgi:hypothetical protein
LTISNRNASYKSRNREEKGRCWLHTLLGHQALPQAWRTSWGSQSCTASQWMTTGRESCGIGWIWGRGRGAAGAAPAPSSSLLLRAASLTTQLRGSRRVRSAARCFFAGHPRRV